jgi:hypothetical protein
MSGRRTQEDPVIDAPEPVLRLYDDICDAIDRATDMGLGPMEVTGALNMARAAYERAVVG